MNFFTFSPPLTSIYFFQHPTVRLNTIYLHLGIKPRTLDQRFFTVLLEEPTDKAELILDIFHVRDVELNMHAYTHELIVPIV